MLEATRFCGVNAETALFECAREQVLVTLDDLMNQLDKNPSAATVTVIATMAENKADTVTISREMADEALNEVKKLCGLEYILLCNVIPDEYDEL